MGLCVTHKSVCKKHHPTKDESKLKSSCQYAELCTFMVNGYATVSIYMAISDLI